MSLGFVLVIGDAWILKEIKMLTYENKTDGLYLTSMRNNFCNSFEVPISADRKDLFFPLFLFKLKQKNCKSEILEFWKKMKLKY